MGTQLLLSGWEMEAPLELRPLLVFVELLRTEDAEIPAAAQPSAPEEEAPSSVVPTAPLLQWDEKKSECVVCMEQEVRTQHLCCQSRGE